MKLRQLRTALSRPDISLEYLQWRLSRIRHRGNARFALPNGAIVSNFNGFSEYHSMLGCMSRAEQRFFAEIPPSGSPIIDVGANIGVVTLLLAKQFPGRHVHAFEPGPTTFDTLQKNVKLNGFTNVSCHRIALSDSVGEISFDADPFKRGNARIAGAGADYATTVPTTTLDTFVAEQGIRSIGLLKIDVEGFETMVLAGAAQTLKDRIVDLVFMEVVPEATISAGFDAKRPVQLVSDAGYDWFRLESNGALTPVTAAEVTRIDYENWVAIPTP